MDKKNISGQWMDWAVELQAIAQNGLTYGRDVYDLERYERVREIAAEIMSVYTDIPLEKVKGVFCQEKGYQTPKLDTRAAVFKEGKILLVKEKAGVWSLPGGWVDVNESIKNNTVKEVKEEAGLDVEAVRLIAIQDRNLQQQALVCVERLQSIYALQSAWRKLSGELRDCRERLFFQGGAASPGGGENDCPTGVHVL